MAVSYVSFPRRGIMQMVSAERIQDNAKPGDSNGTLKLATEIRIEIFRIVLKRNASLNEINHINAPTKFRIQDRHVSYFRRPPEELSLDTKHWPFLQRYETCNSPYLLKASLVPSDDAPQILRVCRLWYKEAAPLLYQVSGFVAWEFISFTGPLLSQIGTIGCANIKELTLMPYTEFHKIPFLDYLANEYRTSFKSLLKEFLQSRKLPNLQILRFENVRSWPGFGNCGLPEIFRRRDGIFHALQVALQSQSVLTEIIWLERQVKYQEVQFADTTETVTCVEAAMYQPGKGTKERSWEDEDMV